MRRSDFLLGKINESVLYISDELKDILAATRSEIGKRMIELSRKKISTETTFLDLSGKAGNVLVNTYKKGGENLMKALSKTADDDEIEKEKANLAEDAPLSITDETIFDTIGKGKDRNDAKMTKVVNALFPGEYTTAEGQEKLREFIGEYKALTSDMYFELVSGEEIRDWYDEECYFPGSKKSDLHRSCMRDSSCRSYFDIYVKNPDVCSLLIYRNKGGLIKGRAVIWKVEYRDDEYLMMDRVYFVDEEAKQAFISHAEENGWMYRESQSAGTTKRFMLNGKRMSADLTLDLEEWEFDEYPYIDTFCKLYTDTGVLTNEDDREEGSYILQDTSGGYTDGETVYSEYLDSDIPERDSVWSEPENSYILRDDAIEYTNWNGNRVWYPIDHEEIVYVPEEDRHMHMEETSWSEHYQEYVSHDNSTDVVGNINKILPYKLDYDEDYVLMKDTVKAEEMMCHEWLEHIGKDDVYFIDDNVSMQVSSTAGGESAKKYYIIDYKVETYETEMGYLSSVDCIALGIQPSSDAILHQAKIMDVPSYNWGMDLKVMEEIEKALNEKIESSEPGTATNLEARLSQISEWIKEKR